METLYMQLHVNQSWTIRPKSEDMKVLAWSWCEIQSLCWCNEHCAATSCSRPPHVSSLQVACPPISCLSLLCWPLKVKKPKNTKKKVVSWLSQFNKGVCEITRVYFFSSLRHFFFKWTTSQRAECCLLLSDTESADRPWTARLVFFREQMSF